MTARSDESAGQTSPDAGSICIGCGLCCDGTLHSNTRVKKDDEDSVAAAGLPVVLDEGKRVFRQPCPHFANGRCGIYAQRPPVCRTYKCALLQNVEQGAISIADARQKILTAKSLAQAIRNSSTEVATPSRRAELKARLQEQLGGRKGKERTAIAKRLLDLGILDHFLMRWFHKPKSDGQGVGTIIQVEPSPLPMEQKSG